MRALPPLHRRHAGRHGHRAQAVLRRDAGVALTYDAAEARQELLDSVAEAVDSIAAALAALGSAYEQLDEAGADRLEDALFRPVQAAYGRAKRTHAGFSQRLGLPAREFTPAAAGTLAASTAALVDRAVEHVDHAEDVLSELQDSMLPVEVGDAEVRAGIAGVRELLAPVPAGAGAFTRGLGR